MLRLMIFISYLIVIVTHVDAEPSACPQHQCIAVIDAGSTGSRLHVFSYDLDETNTPTHINEIGSKKIKPGFAMIEADQTAIDTYLDFLFLGAPTQKMPVYFYATGGMRLVPQTKQKIYYQAVQNWFNQKAIWQLIDVKTITGNDEALYDWLAVNYHLDKLKSSTELVGVMDIGGASVQIVFPTQKNSEPSSGSIIELELYGQHINLFVHSFLGLGQNEMSHQLLDTTSCFSEGYSLPDGELGKGDAVSCKKEISSLINHVHKVKDEVQPILTASRVNQWYVIGGLAHLAESKPFHFQKNQITNEDLLQQANSLVCHQPWDSINNQFPNNEQVESFCLLPAFYYALMVDGYGLSMNQPVYFIPVSQNLNWTLGVVLYH